MNEKASLRVLNSSSDNRKSAIQNPKWAGIFAIAVTFVFGGAVAQAQRPTKVPRIGFLDNSTASGSAVLVDAFRQELGKLGWIEGKNIVMTNPADPVGEGMVASLARPGGNVTGLSGLAVELNTKRLEILKDAVPKLARVGLLRPPGDSITLGSN